MRRPSALLEPLPLVLIAAVAGLLAPSAALARRSDLILAALVLAVALTIAPRQLAEAAPQWRRVALAAALPLVTLLPLAVALGQLFDPPVRQGLLALGLAPTEVAAAGLVALAGGQAAFALAVVALSLTVSALTAPLLAPALAGAEVDAFGLAARFSIVVLVPLGLGLALRSGARLTAAGPIAERATGPALALLVYAALGDLGERSTLAPAALAGALFLAGSVVIAVTGALLLGDWSTIACVFSLRDFAVAAALAVQLGAPGAAATAAVYGVLMLVVAAGAASVLRPAGQA